MLFPLTKDSFVLDDYVVSNFKYNTFVCAQLVLFCPNSLISGIPSLYHNSNTSNHRLDVAIEPTIEQLNIHSNVGAFVGYMESFET